MEEGSLPRALQLVQAGGGIEAAQGLARKEVRCCGVRMWVCGKKRVRIWGLARTEVRCCGVRMWVCGCVAFLLWRGMWEAWGSCEGRS